MKVEGLQADYCPLLLVSKNKEYDLSKQLQLFTDRFTFVNEYRFSTHRSNCIEGVQKIRPFILCYSIRPK
jgi:hypothetical protein